MTTHNNPDSCYKALEALEVSLMSSMLTGHVFLANSGTSISSYLKRLRSLEITEIATEEDTYWAAGMRRSWLEAKRHGTKFRYVLWLNDDTWMNSDSLEVLIQTLDSSASAALAVGSCIDSSGQHTYGGQSQRSALLPLHFKLIKPSSSVQKCDTFNGNLILSSFKLHESLGGFPANYTHLRADFAFGLEANRGSVPLLLAPGAVAHCEHNSTYPEYDSLKRASLRDRLSFLNNPKFGPWREHVLFTMKFGGPFKLLYLVAPLIRVLLAR